MIETYSIIVVTRKSGLVYYKLNRFSLFKNKILQIL